MAGSRALCEVSAPRKVPLRLPYVVNGRSPGRIRGGFAGSGTGTATWPTRVTRVTEVTGVTAWRQEFLKYAPYRREQEERWTRQPRLARVRHRCQRGCPMVVDVTTGS